MLPWICCHELSVTVFVSMTWLTHLFSLFPCFLILVPDHLRSPHEDVLHSCPEHFKLSESVVEVHHVAVLRIGQHTDTLLLTNSFSLQTADHIFRRREQASESLNVLVMILNPCDSCLTPFSTLAMAVRQAWTDILECRLQNGFDHSFQFWDYHSSGPDSQGLEAVSMGLLQESRRDWIDRGSKGVVQCVLGSVKTSTSMSINNGSKAEDGMAFLQKRLTATSCKDSARSAGRQCRDLVSQDADSRLDAQQPA